MADNAKKLAEDDATAAKKRSDNVARIIGEDTDTLLFDEFGALAITDEYIAGAAIDGANNIFPLVLVAKGVNIL
ncbi:MAG: hypothetical protein P1P93_02185 [Gammaproteobacteria bacterium]|nr:hypothetical protein [Gammaproteobacteria bacterium]